MIPNWYVQKAEACAAAWKARYKSVPTRRAILLLCAVAHLETDCGDAWGFSGNWGAIQRRAMTSAEKALVASGGTPKPRDAYEELHGDSSPVTGRYAVWFWCFRNADGTPDDLSGADKLCEVLLDQRPVIRRDINDLDARGLALDMYRTGYYEGAHDPRLQPGQALDKDGLTPGQAANILDYANAVQRGLDAFNANLPRDWAPHPPLPAWLQALRDPLPGETKGEHYWRAASHFVGCSLSARFDELVALASVCNPDPAAAEAAARLQTNCGTFERWVIALVGDRDPFATRPDAVGMSVSWDLQIGADEGAIVRGAGSALKALARGFLIHYGTAGVNNDHMELCGSTPDPATHEADHLGGGRADNAVTQGRSDIRWSLGRGIEEAVDPDKLSIAGEASKPTPAPSPPPPPVPMPGHIDLTKVAGYQTALKLLSFDPGPIDGIPGLRTRAAVRAFQAAHPPLQVDGVVGPATRSALALALGQHG